MPSWTRPIISFVAALGGAGACAGPGAGAAAAAAPPAPVTPVCANETLSQPFARYGDSNEYFLTPGGDFTTAGAGWSFTGGARVVADPLSPSGYAADIPSGGSVTSPAFCVTANDPVARMFAYTTVSGDGASLQPALISSSGLVHTIGLLPELTKWGPTGPSR